MQTRQADVIFAALDGLRIELPSWGFANTGTRFGKFLQAAAASTLEEKFSDAGHVHAVTGVCPTLALHVLWDLPQGVDSSDEVERLSKKFEVARPSGAFYIFPKAPRGMSATEFVAKAIDNNVLVIPGNVFSERDTHFRISYATTDEKLKQGVGILNSLA